MTNNTDDFDADFQEATVQRPASAKGGMGGNLAAAWQGSPLFKLLILVIGVGAVAAAGMALLSSTDQTKTTNRVTVGSASSVSEVPGSKAPPAYVDAVNDASQKRAEEAIQKEKSALPTPVLNEQPNYQKPETNYDPLAEFRPQPVQQQQQVIQQVPTAPPAPDPADEATTGKMGTQMTALFDSWRPEGIKLVTIADAATLNQQTSGGGVLPNDAPADNARTIVPAGSVFYGQLLTEANSDAPGPILLQIMSGPFTGGRAIGQFEVTREFLILRFSNISYKKKDYPVDIIALDPNTTLGGLLTEKDNRYFTRVILPAGAAFLEGLGDALSSTTTTQVPTSDGQVVVFEEAEKGLEDGLYQGLSEGTKTVGDFFRDEASATKPLLRVAAGTPMGLFFTQSVQDVNKSTPLPNPNFSGTSRIAVPNSSSLAANPNSLSDPAKKSSGNLNQAP